MFHPRAHRVLPGFYRVNKSLLSGRSIVIFWGLWTSSKWKAVPPPHRYRFPIRRTRRKAIRRGSSRGPFRRRQSSSSGLALLRSVASNWIKDDGVGGVAMRRPLQAKPKKNEDIFFLSTLSWNLRGGGRLELVARTKKMPILICFLVVFTKRRRWREPHCAHPVRPGKSLSQSAGPRRIDIDRNHTDWRFLLWTTGFWFSYSSNLSIRDRTSAVCGIHRRFYLLSFKKKSKSKKKIEKSSLLVAFFKARG